MRKEDAKSVLTGTPTLHTVGKDDLFEEATDMFEL